MSGTICNNSHKTASALYFAEKLGWTVFPAPPGEKKSYKSADFSDGRKWGATKDSDEIRRDFANWPNANIGIPTGAANGFFVIDVDTVAGGHKDGFASLAALETEHGQLPVTAQVESPSGSIHYYFKHPGFHVKNSTSELAPGIDVRGDGGMVLAPPSVKPGVGIYKWRTSDPLVGAPQWILDRVKIAQQAERKVDATKTRNSACPGDTRRVLDWMIANNKIETDDDWRKIGMSLRDEFGDDPGLGLFSRICYDQTVDAKALSRWNSYEPGKGIGIGTLRQMAGDARCPYTIGKSLEAMFGGETWSPPLAPLGPLPAGTPLPALGEDDGQAQTPPAKLIQTSAEFVAGFVAPSYLLDGILQRRFCYSLTAATGAGKTAIALRLAAHVATGRKLGDRDVERGSVLYFASENSVDVQARWIAMAEHCGFDLDNIDVHFVSGATKLSEIADQITAEAQTIGDLALVVVDTSAATFEGTEENGNVDSLQHAKRFRSLTGLRGGPTVLALCHPVKSATNDNLIPRGGGAFIAEIDGNLCARKSDTAVEVHWAGKFRGMDFAPMLFRLDTVTAQRLKDGRGRAMPTVLATPMDDAGKNALAVAARSDEDQVLRAIDERPGTSSNEIAKGLAWKMRDGRPYGVRVRRATEKLAGDGLVLKHRGAWVLSARGEKELNNLDSKGARKNYPLTPGTDDQNSAVPIMPAMPPRKAE